jgi:hypothetical protein
MHPELSANHYAPKRTIYD